MAIKIGVTRPIWQQKWSEETNYDKFVCQDQSGRTYFGVTDHLYMYADTGTADLEVWPSLYCSIYSN